MTEDTIVINYSTNLDEYQRQVEEIIKLTELLEEKLKRLNIKVTINQSEPSK